MSAPVLVDTSVWVDHFRSGDERLIALLEEGRVLGHPMVIGELACGRLRRRESILAWLAELPSATVASHQEVLAFIGNQGLVGSGIGYVDAHLLASTLLTAPARLWTRDRHLQSEARSLGVAETAPGGA